ncbi:MAG: T9SS type A sorting domain-containing protein, partial [Flavobacteriales bacterium]|nr:T9SS type A sorting domain-containing protein [Flavobacteriales bacterium]
DNPCHQLIDINNDGVIGVTDRLYIIGQYGTTCSNNLSNAPTTARTLDDRIGHVLTATAEPNPGVGQYRITHQLPGEGAIDITVVDHQGRVVVRRSAADQPTLLLDLQDQQPGTYTAVLVRNENLSTVRLVKE